MLKHCSALVYCSERHRYVQLSHLLKQSGFEDTRHIASGSVGLSEFKKGPVPFMFLLSNIPMDVVHKIITNVRTQNELNLRFTPVIMLCEEAQKDQILKYVQLGFDDVVLFPTTAGQLVKRLPMQIDRQIDYFQTENYFGPDRRRFETPEKREKAKKMRGKNAQFYRHFVIERTARSGMKILSTTTHMPDNPAMVAHL